MSSSKFHHCANWPLKQEGHRGEADLLNSLFSNSDFLQYLGLYCGEVTHSLVFVLHLHQFNILVPCKVFLVGGPTKSGSRL